MKPFCLFAILLTACAAEPASGQSWFPEKDGRPRVAVVLSGGGARGLAHVGVLKVIEEVGMPIDLITGTSMGAVVGGLYASGYDAQTLAGLTTKTDWNTLLSDQPFRNRLSMDEKLRDGRYIADLPVEGLKVKLPSGLLSGQRAGVMLTRLTWPVHHIHDFSRLPIPFACLATDIETGEDVLLTEGYLPEAIRASMAIPSAFTPVDLDGRLLVDGGVVRNLPAVDARRLGADLVICSDVSRELSTRDELDSIISIMEQTFNFEYWASVSAQRRECDLVISPELDESGTFDFARADWIMEQGELAARNRLPRLEALADSVRRMGVWRKPWRPAEIDSVYVVDVEVEGLERVPAAVVVGQIDLPLPGWVTASDLEAAVDRIYSTRFFERVTYRIDAHSDGIGSALLIQTSERAEGEVRFGFRYDLRNQSRLIVATTFRNVISRGSKLVLETQIGNRMALASDYTLKMGLQGRLGIRFQGELVQDKFDEYLDGKPVAQLSTRSASLEAGLATVFSTRAYYGLSLVAEYARTAPRLAEIDGYQITTARLLMPAATIWIDTFDQLPFPRRGVFFFMRSIVAGKRFGSDLSMGQHLAIWSRAQPLFRWLTLFTDVECATTFGDRQAIPGGLRLGLGGLVKGPFEFGRFVGLASNERGGRYMTKAGARVQIEFQQRRYLTLLWNVGTASNTWSWNVYGDNEVIFGYGATLGLETIVGPVELTIGTGNRDQARLTFNLGHRF